MKRIFSILILLLFAAAAYGQKVSVSGTVKDIDGQPVIGAGVIEDGTANGVMTDADGAFSIKVAQNASIRVSLIGYADWVEPLAGRTVLEIVLREDQEFLDEVVVIGYGTVKKRDLTGSVSSVKGSDIQQFAVPDAVMALQGKVPGVVLSQNTGDPSGDYSIRIRGTNSVKGSNDPLYIIDGIPQSTSSINTYEVESIEVLKDASATAIYGSRGANGVVLITTKKGRDAKTKISYNGEVGVSTVINRLDLMDAQEWAKFYNEYEDNQGHAKPFSKREIEALGKGTDWQSLIFRPAVTHTHNFNISGGTKGIQYSVNLSAMNKDGVVIASWYNKYAVRANLVVNPYSWMTASVTMGYTMTDKRGQTSAGGSSGSSLISAAYSCYPALGPYDENGDYTDLRSPYSWTGGREVRNPLMIANEYSNITKTSQGNISGSLTIKPVKGLSIKGMVSLQEANARTDQYATSKYIYDEGNTGKVVTRNNKDFLFEATASYSLDKGDHHFDILGGYTYETAIMRSLDSGTNIGFLSDLLYTDDLGGAAVHGVPDSDFTKWVLMSGLGRANYSFKSRYLFTVSMRADGSSRYSPGKRWGYFPSAALAWIISDEPWMKNAGWLDHLKIRAGYGLTGSTAISPYQTQNLLVSGVSPAAGGYFTSYYPPKIYPGDLKWETTAQWDAGFDLEVLKKRLKISFDFYHKMTTDLLNSVKAAYNTGYTDTWKNIGSMSNMGVELLIDAVAVEKRNVGLSIQFNVAHNRNRVESLADHQDIYGDTFNSYGSGMLNIIREGYPIGSFFLYKCEGISQSTGQLVYTDLDNDGLYDDKKDRYVAGSPFPVVTGGLNFGLRLWDFDFNFFLQASIGNKIYNLSAMRNLSYTDGLNVEKDVYYKSYRVGADNTYAKYPLITRPGALRFSDRFLEDGSYLRLKNIQLAYNLPCSKISWLSAFRIYISAQNLFTVTKYSGLDPEVNSKGSDINAGIDHFTYPNYRTYNLGLQVTF